MAGVGPKPRQAAVAPDLLLRSRRQEELALGCGVERQGRAGLRADLEAGAGAGGAGVDGDGVVPAADRQEDAGPQSLGQLFQKGVGHPAHVPEGRDRAAALIEADAQAVAPVRVLGDHLILPQGGQQGVGRALGVAAAGAELLEAQGPPLPEQQLQQLHGLPQGLHRSLRFPHDHTFFSTFSRSARWRCRGRRLDAPCQLFGTDTGPSKASAPTANPIRFPHHSRFPCKMQ